MGSHTGANLNEKWVTHSVTRLLDYLFNILAMYNNEDLPKVPKKIK